MRILVTGGNGYVGSALCRRLSRDGHAVRASVLPGQGLPPGSEGVECVAVPPLGGDTEWGEALCGIEVVIHLAARVHVLKEKAADPLAAFRLANREGSVRLARSAAAAGVRRLLFMSTVGVHGNRTPPGAPLKEGDPARPHNHYSLSKWEAEESLRLLCREGGMELVVLRAPLVYGPGNPGNFRALLDLVHRKVPLPLGAVRNRRSFLYLHNLVDALALCATHPGAAGKSFLVSDREETSTPALVARLAEALGTSPRIFPVPVPLLRLGGTLAGKGSAVAGLVDSLTVDSSAIAGDLGWRPPFSLEEGVRETAAWYLHQSDQSRGTP